MSDEKEPNLLRVPDPETHEWGGMYLVPDPAYALRMLDIMGDELLDQGADLGVLNPVVAHREELRHEAQRRAPAEQAGAMAVAGYSILDGRLVPDVVVNLLLFRLP